MPLAHSIREIQNLVSSFHPVIVIETVEEERVHDLLMAATKDMQMAMFEWSIAQGLGRVAGSFDAPWVNEYAPPGTIQASTFENTAEPLPLLKHMADMSLKALFWLKDFAKYFDEPVITRQFRELVQRFAENRAAIVITGDTVELPPEINHAAVYFNLKLPEQDELHKAVLEVVRGLKFKRRIQVNISEQDLVVLVQALSGMTLQQARQVLAYAALEDGQLTAADVRQILHRKSQVIRAGSLLEYYPLDEVEAELGGFAGLKRWLDQVRVGFSAKARALNLQAPKGILIVGIQGCGKSLAAKAIAKGWRLPLLKLDAGRLFDKYVGESEKNFRQAVALAESMSPTILWIDEIE
ncbi:MAG: AAA family ATPase, partial [Cyanobacteria bacterium P01_H01_bin.121]